MWGGRIVPCKPFGRSHMRATLCAIALDNRGVTAEGDRDSTAHKRKVAGGSFR